MRRRKSLWNEAEKQCAATRWRPKRFGPLPPYRGLRNGQHKRPVTMPKFNLPEDKDAS